MKNNCLLLLPILLVISSLSAQENSNVKLIEYIFFSRGSSMEIKLDNKKITFNDSIQNIDEKSWKKLTSLIQNVDLKNMDKLEAPSNKRFSDMAATAYLRIKVQDASYESSQFDHGNAPKEISLLVSEILALTEF